MSYKFTTIIQIGPVRYEQEEETLIGILEHLGIAYQFTDNTLTFGYESPITHALVTLAIIEYYAGV